MSIIHTGSENRKDDKGWKREISKEGGILPSFDSGVASYVKAYAVVEVNFPVDFKGNADISCYQCQFFSRNNGICQLNKAVVANPQKFVGAQCPLIRKDED